MLIEHIKPVPEAVLPFLSSYTSGAIAEGDPIKVCFSDVQVLKIKQGDPIPAKAFSFQPHLKGTPYWIDERTIGFKYENMGNRPYFATVRMSDFVEVPSDMTLQFGFGKLRQGMNLVETVPVCDGTDKMGYVLRVAFANPVSEEEVLSLLDKDFVKSYAPVVHGAGINVYDIEIAGLERNHNDRNIMVTLNGKALKCDSNTQTKLVVYAKDTFEPIQWSVDKAAGHGVLYFSQPLKETQNLDGFVKFNPEIGYRANVSGNKIDFFFEKSNMYRYQLEEMQIQVEPGIRAADGRALQTNAEYTFSLADDLPKVRWTTEGNIIPEVDDATVYFDAVCLQSVTLRIVRVYDDNILSFLQDNDLDDTYGIRKAGRLVRKVRMEVENPHPTQWKTFPIVLSDYITVEPGAMYQLILDFGPEDYTFATDEMKAFVSENREQEEDYWNGQNYDYKAYCYDGSWNDPNGLSYYNYVEEKKNIVISNLAVTAKMGRDDVLDAFVYRISDATPVSGAKVTAYDFQRQELATAMTDSKGHVRLSCANSPIFVVASDAKGSKSVIKTMRGNALSYSKFDVSGGTINNGVSAFIYSNRGVWRPGDEMQLNFMLSDFDNQVPEQYPVVMEVYDACSRLYDKQVKTNNMGGIYCFNVSTNPSDETGQWLVKFKVGTMVFTKTLRVETVKPNRLEMRLDLPERVSLNKTRNVDLTAKWMNGLKANGLKAEVDAWVRKGSTSFEDFENYTFVNETEDFYDEGITVFSGSLNGNGYASVSMEPLMGINSTQMLDATFTTKVFEQGGEFSITSTKATISPLKRYVGVSLPDANNRFGDFYATDKNWRFDIAVVDENGSLNHSSLRLEYALYKLDSYWWWSSEYDYSLQRYANGTYRRPVQSGTLTCNGTTSIELNVSGRQWGSYLLVVDDPMGGSRFAKVIFFDEGKYGKRSVVDSNGPVQLPLKSASKSYFVGEEIVVTFPANKGAKALVTIEANDKVIETIYLDKLDAEGVLKIKATEAMVPNAYVYIALLQPRDANNDMPVRMYGVVPVMVENKAAELKPVIDVPAETNTGKKVTVKVGENNGKAMTYTLAVVDEGILSLTRYATPNPCLHFNGKQALAVRTWDNYGSIIDAYSGDFGSVYAIGGDDAVNREATLDKRFKAYAITLGPFELKGGKTNSHEIEVPPCSGALRFMVVAKGGEKSFGSADKQMKVIDPITLYPVMPRVVAPGDELTLKVQVLSSTIKGKSLNVKVENHNLTPIGTLPTTVEMDANGEGMIAMRVRVDNAIGNAVAKLTVTAPDYEAQSTTEMPIRMPYAEKRHLFTEEIAPNQTVEIPFALDGLQGSQTGNVMLASKLPIDLFGRLEYLKSYPHGCLEQVTSKAMPQLFLPCFVKMDETETDEMRKNIQNVINDLRTYQKPDKSLANWVGGRYSDPWTEIYALHFLVEAQKQGFDVPDYFLSGLVKYQADKAKVWKDNPDFKQGETIQAYRLFVLALAGSPETGAMNRFKEKEMYYPLTKALSAAAFAQIGKKTIAQRLLPNGDEDAVMSDYKTSFGSRSRDLAFTIYTQMLCGVDALTVQANVESLCGILNSDQWLDTQSTAMALYALGKFAEQSGLTGAAISALVKVNGVEQTLNGNMNAIGIDFVPNMGNNKVVVRNNADQKVFAKVFAKTSVAEYETEETGNYIKMKVRYCDKQGAPISTDNLRMGTDFSVVMTVENPSEYSVTELALSYYVPSGWEIVNACFDDENASLSAAKHADVRDDRAYIYFDLMPRTEASFSLPLNATYEGSYMIPAIRCEDMYSDQIYYVIPAKKTVVK